MIRLDVLNRDLAHVASFLPNLELGGHRLLGQTRYNSHLIRSLRALYLSNPDEFPYHKFEAKSQDAGWSAFDWHSTRPGIVTVVALAVHADEKKQAASAALREFFRHVLGITEIELESQPPPPTDVDVEGEVTGSWDRGVPEEDKEEDAQEEGDPLTGPEFSSTAPASSAGESEEKYGAEVKRRKRGVTSEPSRGSGSRRKSYRSGDQQRREAAAEAQTGEALGARGHLKHSKATSLVMSNPQLWNVFIQTSLFADASFTQRFQQGFYSDRNAMGPGDFLFVGGRFKPDLAHCMHFVEADKCQSKPIQVVRLGILRQHTEQCLLKDWDPEDKERKELDQWWQLRAEDTGLPAGRGSPQTRVLWDFVIPRARIPLEIWRGEHPFWKSKTYSHPELQWLTEAPASTVQRHFSAQLPVPHWSSVYQQVSTYALRCLKRPSDFPFALPCPSWEAVQRTRCETFTAGWFAVYLRVVAELRQVIEQRRQEFQQNNLSTMFWSHSQEWNLSELFCFYRDAVPLRAAHPLRTRFTWTLSHVPPAMDQWSTLTQAKQDAAMFLMSHFDLEMQHPTLTSKTVKHHVLYARLSEVHSMLADRLKERLIPFDVLAALPRRTLCDAPEVADKRKKGARKCPCLTYSEQYKWFRQLQREAWGVPKTWICVRGLNEIKEFIQIVGEVHSYPTDRLLDYSLGVHTVVSKMPGESLL